MAHGADSDYKIKLKTGENVTFPEISWSEVSDWSYGNGEKIPTLEEILIEIKGDIKIFIDLKGKNRLVFEKALLLVLKYGVLDQTIFISFSHDFFYDTEEILNNHNLYHILDRIKCGFLMESHNDKPNLDKIKNKSKFIIDVDMLNFLNQAETREFVLHAASLGLKII